jgi:hypothetical protein
MRDLPFPQWFLRACVGLAVLASAGGFLLDSKGFGTNLLADGVAFPTGVLVGALLIDRLIAVDRKRRWQLVADGTVETLRVAVVKTGMAIYMQLPAPRPPNADPMTMEAAGEIDAALAHLSTALRAQRDDPRADAGDLEAVGQTVVPHLRLIREVILPRLLLIGKEPPIVRPLVRLEQSLEHLDYDIWMSERFGLPSAALFEDLATIIDDMRDVMVVLADAS